MTDTNLRVAIVTPTIGSPALAKCLESIQNQDYENLTHYVFLDGEDHYDKITPQLKAVSGKREIKTVSLQDNVGKGFYGHRVYAACTFLVNADVIIYLDEDHWYDPNHATSMVNTLTTNKYDWAYSLRKVYNKAGEFICNDNCESLGQWPTYFNDKVHHIDTACFAVMRNTALNVGHAWYGRWGADRQFRQAVSKYYPNYGCSKEYTACYRVEGNEGSVTSDFFTKGNQVMEDRYKGKFPWVK